MHRLVKRCQVKGEEVKIEPEDLALLCVSIVALALMLSGVI